MGLQFVKLCCCCHCFLLFSFFFSNRAPRIFRLLVIIGVHSGQTSAAGILSQVLINCKNTNNVSCYIADHQNCLPESLVHLNLQVFSSKNSFLSILAFLEKFV